MEKAEAVFLAVFRGGVCKNSSKKVEKVFIGVLTRGEFCSIIMSEGCYTRRYDHGSEEIDNGFFKFQV